MSKGGQGNGRQKKKEKNNSHRNKAINKAPLSLSLRVGVRRFCFEAIAPSVRVRPSRRSSRLQIVATVSGCREFRPSLQPTFVSAVSLPCSKWGLGNARVARCVQPKFVADSAHFSSVSSSSSSARGGPTSIFMEQLRRRWDWEGGKERGDIAEGKASTERITICHLF